MVNFQDQLLVTVAQAAADRPDLQQRRAQAAAVADAYFQAKDTYTTVQPWLFTVGVLGLFASAAAVTKRRKVGEAWALYGATGAASAALAWVSRPAALRAAPTPGAAAGPSWVDARVARLTSTRPGWEAATWGRVARDFGPGTLTAQNPAIQILLTRNTK